MAPGSARSTGTFLKNPFYARTAAENQCSACKLQVDLDVPVNEQFNFEPAELRVTFIFDGQVYALQLGSSKAFESFLQQYNKAVFENQFGVEHLTTNVGKVSFLTSLLSARQDKCVQCHSCLEATLHCTWATRPMTHSSSGQQTWMWSTLIQMSSHPERTS